jgi:phospholipase/lecithinase/hemolysin
MGIQRRLLNTTGMVGFALATIVGGGEVARGGDITGIVSFGDSLTDVGNVYIATTGAMPPAPYWQGHYSNGPIWVEYLAYDLGLAAPTPSLAGGTDYAFGGAETSTSGLSTLGTPNIGTQIGMYLQGGNTPSASQLFTIWGGANDFLLGGQTNPATPVANIGQEITELAAAGAKQFLIGNLPLLGEIPIASSLTLAQQQGLNYLSMKFDTMLQTEVSQLSKSLGVDISIMNVEGLVQDAMANPAKYGFTNVTSGALEDGNLGAQGYLFWDEEHPTTAADQFIADVALSSIPEPSSFVLLATAVCSLIIVAGLSRRVGWGVFGS